MRLHGPNGAGGASYGLAIERPADERALIWGDID